METGNKIISISSTVNTNFNYVDPSFDVEKSSHSYHLSIEVGLYCFSYAVLDIINKKYVVWGCNTSNFDEIEALIRQLDNHIKESNFLALEYRSSSVAYCAFPSTLVPSIYYDKTKEKELFQFNYGTCSAAIKSDNLSSLSANHLYRVPEELTEWVNKKWRKATTLHIGSILIEQLVVVSKSITKSCIYVNVQQNSFDLIIAKNGQLNLYNSFSYTAAEDIIYYILYSLEQLEIRNYEIELTLLGQVKKEEPLVDLLTSYIKEVNFVKNNNKIALSNAFNQPSYAGYTLFSQYLCV